MVSTRGRIYTGRGQNCLGCDRATEYLSALGSIRLPLCNDCVEHLESHATELRGLIRRILRRDA